jgi:pilus assembly protein Flp/PilA
MKSLLTRLKQEEDGGHLIEYALVAGVIALGAIASLTLLKTQIIAAFTKVGTTLKGSF